MGNEVPQNRYETSDPSVWEMIQIDQQEIQRNKNNYPNSNYARVSNRRPKLLPEVQDTLKNQLKRPAASEKYPTFELLKSPDVYYEGQWQAGKENGKGSALSLNGTYYQGAFKDGKPNGKGFHVYPDGSYYKGDFVNGLFEGVGVFWYKKNGMTYDGDWKAGKPNGQGKENFPGVGVYTGGFLNGLKHGNGEMKWNDQRLYQGDFFEGYMHGQGVLKKKDGIYTGKFDRNNKVSGPMKTQNGEYVGPYVNGEMSGKGKFTWRNGNIYEGDFKYNRLHGSGKLRLNNGIEYTGQWQNGINIMLNNV